MNSPEIAYEGVTFDSLRAALCATYFMRDGMTQEEWREALGYVIPMQHNFENPITPCAQDTWIQFWIDEDDRHTQDFNSQDKNQTLKTASVSVRFLGRRAETWAKAFHHLTKRKGVPKYFYEYCNGQMLDFISPIVAINVDYFGVGNTTIAHDLSFDIVYVEYMRFDWQPLEFIALAPGDVIIQGAYKEPAFVGEEV